MLTAGGALPGGDGVHNGRVTRGLRTRAVHDRHEARAAVRSEIGVPPDAPKAGLAQTELADGTVTVRSDVDGSLETDRIFEANPAFAKCAIPNRKKHDVRGYWAEWKLSAQGNPFQALVKSFGGRDPADEKAAECLRKAIESTQLRCPRDGKVVTVKTAICL